MHLTSNFTLHQLVDEPLAYWHAIHQQFDPPPAVVTALRETAEAVLEPLHKVFGGDLQIVSAFKHKHINFLFGGDNRDYHVIGRAVDVRVRGWDNWRLFDYVRSNMKFHYLVPEFMEPDNAVKGWIHISYVTNKPLKQAVVYKHQKNFGAVVMDEGAEIKELEDGDVDYE